MGWGSQIDPATGRKKREVGGMARNARNRAKNGRSGGLERWNGRPVEKRITRARRAKMRRGSR